MVLSKSSRAFTLSLVGACALTSTGALADVADAASTYLGDAVGYSYGTVQVQITVDGSNKITQIDTPQVSTRGSNSSYTNYALPILVKEALTAQSANIQGVSGASYLSRGWITSLASAIAKIGATSATPSTPSTPTPVTTPTPVLSPIPTPTKTLTPLQPPQQPQVGDDGSRPLFNNGEGEGERNREGGDENGGGHRDRPQPQQSQSRPLPIVKSPTPSPTSTPSTSLSPAPSLGLRPGAGVIQKSLTCLKGSTVKVVKGLNPKCPAGFKAKTH